VDFDNRSIILGSSVATSSRSIRMLWSVNSSLTNPFELVSFKRELLMFTFNFDNDAFDVFGTGEIQFNVSFHVIQIGVRTLSL